MTFKKGLNIGICYIKKNDWKKELKDGIFYFLYPMVSQSNSEEIQFTYRKWLNPTERIPHERTGEL